MKGFSFSTSQIVFVVVFLIVVIIALLFSTQFKNLLSEYFSNITSIWRK